MNKLNAKLMRYAARHLHRDILPTPDQSVISIGFDDCPRSVLENALPLLEAEGWRATIYVAIGLCDTTNHLGKHLSKQDLKNIAERGHEIADHTFSHNSASEAAAADYLADIENNQDALVSLGIAPSRHFAFPYGHATPDVKQALSKRFLTARGVIPPTSPELDSNLLNAMPIYSGKAVDAIIERLPDLNRNPQWLNLFSHDVRTNPSEFGCTIEELKLVISEIKINGLKVQTVGEAYDDLMTEKRAIA